MIHLKSKRQIVGSIVGLGLGVISLAAIGCSKGSTTGTSATKEEQKYYANPIKEPPPEAGQIGGPPQVGSGGAPAGGEAPKTGGQ